MWIAGLCAFPPLFSGQPIDLGSAGAVVKTSFEVPVEKSYPLAMTFEFASVEARLNDQIVGERYSEHCQGDVQYSAIPEQQRKGLGQPIPFRVVIRKAADHAIVLDRTFVSLCVTSHGQNAKTRTIGWLPLATGHYVAEVTNLEGQSGLPGVKTALSLYGGQGK
ncbi:DUF5625 family protein [Chitinibacteraceae bacterium HSL-7]